ncbi:MAG: thioredoxin domain-containing protein, partial [Bacteroidales bacterium]
KLLKENNKYTNELIRESSPYLLQHAHNPVNWYPWGEEALKKAQAENKILIISIGYAACHWCHVMEHESFEDTTVANLMNKYFVCIKVDREERPDVDQVYMNAAQLITGSGGWPLNAFALPDGKPFYVGTYFPKSDWIKVMDYFTEVYKKKPAMLAEQAEKVTQGIHAIENTPSLEQKVSFTPDDLNNIFDNWKSNIDFHKGGINRAPKFPIPCVWEYMMYYGYLTGNLEALEAVTTTLDNIAFGGIYDHIGGGFARYSTDADWHVPHFEKMLYDNAQLVSLYVHAWQQTKKPLYKKVVYETLEFIERQMTSPEGGFYCSLDADSDGEEGKFYVWTYAEVDKILHKNAGIFMEYYNITRQGNWEHGKNILYRTMDDSEFALKNNLSVDELRETIRKSKAELLNARDKRIRPGLDDKILTSWNALMLKGYVDAYRAFGEKKFLESALRNAGFILEKTVASNGEITRNYKNGKSSIHGFLDDYAFTISAFIDLYQATFNEKWLDKANEIKEFTKKHFEDTDSGMFYYTHDAYDDLIVRKKELTDNVIPASNSEMAKNLYKLGLYFYNNADIQQAESMLSGVSHQIKNNIYFYANWGILAAYVAKEPYEVAIVGEMYETYRREIDNHYLPDVLLLGGKDQGSLELSKEKYIKGQTTIYVCRDKTCKLPVTEVQQALQQINNNQ